MRRPIFAGRRRRWWRNFKFRVGLPGQFTFTTETALYLLNLTNREPVQYTVTLKAGTNTTELTKQGVKVYGSFANNRRMKELFSADLHNSGAPLFISARQGGSRGQQCQNVGALWMGEYP